MMIFEQFKSKLLDQIDLIIEYHSDHIQIHIKWSVNTDFIQWNLSYHDEQCTLPTSAPLFYLCSTKTSSLNPSFYPNWFLLDSSFYHRLFSSITLDDEHFLLLISMPDGRILALPQSPKDNQPILWYTSFVSHPVVILAWNYDINSNLLDAVLASNTDLTLPKKIYNHLILCDYQGCFVVSNALGLRRILLDSCVKSACIYSNYLIYLTRNEIRSIAIIHLLKPSNDDLITQTKILRFGHFEKLIVGK